MATKERSPKKRRPAVPAKTKVADEQKRVTDWRMEQFVNVLKENGLADDDIDLNIIKELVKGDSSPHDLKRIIKLGCDPETAIRIVA